MTFDPAASHKHHAYRIPHHTSKKGHFHPLLHFGIFPSPAALDEHGRQRLWCCSFCRISLSPRLRSPTDIWQQLLGYQRASTKIVPAPCKISQIQSPPPQLMEDSRETVAIGSRQESWSLILLGCIPFSSGENYPLLS